MATGAFQIRYIKVFIAFFISLSFSYLPLRFEKVNEQSQGAGALIVQWQ